MKKLTILIALALIVTIGGVYATWNYANGTATKGEAYLDEVTKITEKVEGLAKGKITVDSNTLAITIDDADNNHVAELIITGEITFKYTPAADVAQIPMQYTLSLTDNWNYNSKPIFVIDTTTQVLNSGTATNTVTITGAELANLISLNGTITLSTPDEYTAFKSSLHSGSIAIVVSETTTTP